MAQITTVTCDGENCKKLRMHDSNHWLIGRVVLTKAPSEGGLPIVMMAPLDEQFGHWDDGKHFCGEQCATRWFLIEMQKLRG